MVSSFLSTRCYKKYQGMKIKLGAVEVILGWEGQEDTLTSLEVEAGAKANMVGVPTP